MNIDLLALISLILAAVPASLFMLNLMVYRRVGDKRLSSVELNRASQHFSISVLIPARNEQQNIKSCLESVLANQGPEFEVIVMDDHSTDSTAEIVAQIARHDPRLRLESAPPLPSSWCGKQHACFHLAQRARHDWLVFLDADVRLAPDALSRMTAWITTRDVDLASGVPRQLMRSISECLLIPLIHFILLGFLPMHLMRWTRLPAFSAGCGQLFAARRSAYLKCGGHSQIRLSLHDGITLPRLFRRAGFKTDLFDATDLAACRMYQDNSQVWSGLARNATEGLASTATIVPMTILLLGGQVLPLLMLVLGLPMSSFGTSMAILALGLACLPRLLAVPIFKQPVSSALLHPVGILALVAIQWYAWFSSLAGQPSIWKGRPYRGTLPNLHESVKGNPVMANHAKSPYPS